MKLNFISAEEAERRYNLKPGTLHNPDIAKCTASGKLIAFLMLLAAAWLYLIVVFTIARLRHPELTETQLFLRTIDIVLWRLP
ncbi:MAG: hypothetical protein C0483_18620 [Pirellula sp.]|nr:hypothetical protein [Pirellula sp.]